MTYRAVTGRGKHCDLVFWARNYLLLWMWFAFLELVSIEPRILCKWLHLVSSVTMSTLSICHRNLCRCSAPISFTFRAQQFLFRRAHAGPSFMVHVLLLHIKCLKSHLLLNLYIYSARNIYVMNNFQWDVDDFFPLYPAHLFLLS